MEQFLPAILVGVLLGHEAGGMVCQASFRVEDSEVEVSPFGLFGGTRIDRCYGVGRIPVEVV